MLGLTQAGDTRATGIVGSVVSHVSIPYLGHLQLISKKTTRPSRANPEVPDVYRAGREEGPFPSHLVASSSEVFAPSLVESEENPAEGAPSCPDKCKKVLAVP